MYISLEVKFLPLEWERNFLPEEVKLIEEFMDVMSCSVKKDLLKKDSISFHFKLNDDLRNKIFDFIKKARNKIEMCMYADTCYEAKDFADADAFIVNFKRKFSFYDDWNEEKYYSVVMSCTGDMSDRRNRGCGCIDYTEKIYAKPNMGIKKAFFNKYTGATNIEEADATIISEKLYVHLISSGVEEKFFRPVYQKKGNIWAYFLDGSSSVIDSGNIKCSCAEGPVKCQYCGRSLMKRKHKQDLEKFKDSLHEMIFIGDPFECTYWEISDEALKNLKSVNMTEDYFFSVNQMTIVNKELFNAIKEKAPEVLKNSIPVFKMP